MAADAVGSLIEGFRPCHGPAAVDVAHTRCNLMMVDGSEAAERFLVAYEMKDRSYQHHPWWDAAELLTWDDNF